MENFPFLQADPAKQLQSIIPPLQPPTWQQLSLRVAISLVTMIFLPMTLLASAANAEIYQFGSRGERVGEIQRALSRAGFFVKDDKIFGNDTLRATQDFQKSRNLDPDGKVGELTLRSLGLSWAGDGDYGRFFGPISSGGCQFGRVTQLNAGGAFDKRYRVIVPTTQVQMLQKVRYYCPNARTVTTPLGSYISVGSFVNRDSAEAHSQSFHQRGIRDAHVRYF